MRLRCTVPRRALHSQAAPSARAAPTTAARPAATAANIGEYLDRRTSQYEWRDAFRDTKNNIRWTYKELQTQVSGYACGFNAMPGGLRGKRLLALTGNAPESLVTLLAAARIGAASSVLDATLAEEVGPAIEAAKATALIMPPSFDKELLRLVPEFDHPVYRNASAPQGPVRSRRNPSLKFVLTTAWNVDGHTGPIPLREAFWRDPVPSPLPALTASLAPSAAALWETLPAATVAYSHAGLLAQAEALAGAFGLRMEDRVLSALHYSTSAAATVALAAWMRGGALVSSGPEPRDPLLTLKTLASEHPTVLVAPAEVLAAMAAHPSLAKHAIPALRLVVVVAAPGKAPSAAEVERFTQVFKAEQHVLASAVDAAGIALVRPLAASDASLGAPIPGAEARVDGGSGELSVRTPQALHRQVLAGAADEWTPTNLKAAAHDGGFALV